ncbi:MAG: dihydroorotate dehydrogenase [Nitrosopumilus sp. D6]|nr:MAG: dihydroorotate dehydrogenase [Nitrosopumilus sp. D6]
MEPSLAVSIGKMSLDGPAMLASGILGISLEVFGRLYRSGAAALVSKSLSREPWEGYANPTIVGVGGGGWINAVGLSNPGAENFAAMIGSNSDVPVIVSLVGSDPGDFTHMTEQFSKCNILGYELNLSCPHVAKVGLEVGDDLGLVRDIVSAVKKTGAPVIAKVGLGTVNYLDTVGAAVDAGADAITAINTVRAMAIDIHTGRPILSNRFGGLSGTPIKPVAVRCVYEITSRYDVPVIGCGGISTWEDAVEMLLAGASAVQVGSALGEKPNVFSEINAGIKSYMKQHNYSEVQEMTGIARS